VETRHDEVDSRILNTPSTLVTTDCRYRVCLNGNFKVEITQLLIYIHTYNTVYTMAKLAPAQEKGKSPS
jgi:hypothetical protein